ncbi:MAG: hypothetical protein A3J75_06540 [Acidobacteria bacterium RBG_16_68_9]|nr:MAG: hypothetical protein A3J75_06540 [Acidobacteria bacterium RBG_16_68_9]
MATTRDPRITGQVIGAKVVMNRIAAMQGALTSEEGIIAALTAGGLRIRNEAARRAPILTGTLRRSITVEKAKDRPLTVDVGTNVVYAPPHEFGWPERNIKERAYLRGAMIEKRAEVNQVVAKELKGLIDRAKTKAG